MTPSDFARIEQSLGIELPGSYTTLLAAYPPEADSNTRAHTLFEDADRAINTNLAQRSTSCSRIPWPDHYFIIGDNGCDGVYFMAIGKNDRVYFADHEDDLPTTGDLEPFLSAHSPQGHISIALQMEHLDQEFKLHATTRKWWQLWK